LKTGSQENIQEKSPGKAKKIEEQRKFLEELRKEKNKKK